jgi:hypothetical protein
MKVQQQVLARVLALASVFIAPLGCASTAPITSADMPPAEPPPVVMPPPLHTSNPLAPSPPICDAFAKPGTLRRANVSRTIDQGLGRWLAGVDVKPSKQKGRFRGWVITRLYPDDPCYAALDLRPGDVVIPIERPEEANEVFAGLRLAPALVVDYLRDEKPVTLTLPISD